MIRNTTFMFAVQSCIKLAVNFFEKTNKSYWDRPDKKTGIRRWDRPPVSPGSGCEGAPSTRKIRFENISKKSKLYWHVFKIRFGNISKNQDFTGM